jgi:hypothetical protein
MSHVGQSRPGRASSKSGHARRAPVDSAPPQNVALCHEQTLCPGFALKEKAVISFDKGHSWEGNHASTSAGIATILSLMAS